MTPLSPCSDAVTVEVVASASSSLDRFAVGDSASRRLVTVVFVMISLGCFVDLVKIVVRCVLVVCFIIWLSGHWR